MVSKCFHLFPDFDFNSALSTSNGFISPYSSAILQAVKIGVKVGVLDICNHGCYKALIDLGGAMLIDGEETLIDYMKTIDWHISIETLEFYGLKDDVDNGPNTSEYLLQLMNSTSE
jgi:hypothetical protein